MNTKTQLRRIKWVLEKNENFKVPKIGQLVPNLTRSFPNFGQSWPNWGNSDRIAFSDSVVTALLASACVALTSSAEWMETQKCENSTGVIIINRSM
jgi:hypothetical protein